ncbi:hybrid sensor histidine kinase/response regulator [filamentous cyanobacterium CCP3]|nr:hybrid sensor histidine kinase/response regulator [filamentous cyanobacterium CCP3]
MIPEQFLELARLLPEPVLLIAGTGQILAANSSFTKLLGLHYQVLQGKTLFELVTNTPEQVKQYLRNCSSSRETVLGALTLRANTGETYLCRCEGAVVRPRSPESPALIFLRFKNRESASSRFTLLNKKIDELAKEIGKRQRAEEERAQLLVQEQKARAEAEKARAEAENLNRLKDEFLLTVSHELRTPLNAILGWSQLLLSSRLDEATMNRALETIQRNAKSQAQLIEDLLDVSRIIAGKIRLNVQAVELLPVIEATIDTVQPAADAKSIRLQSVLDPAAGSVLGDSERLQQIVWNLLSNAIKFTPKRGRVQVCLQRVNSHVEIVVADTGQGVSAEFLPFIFERFRQADNSITRSFGGLGLGLAIVHQLVELHGGTVHAESPGEGQGATFIVKLPVMALRPEAIAPERVHPAVGSHIPFDDSPRLDGLRILVVDDDADCRNLLVYTLEGCGAEVITAASADEAIAVLSEPSALNILISDIGMPGEDGYALLRRVRALKAKDKADIPAIALTAYAKTQNRRAALLAGFQSHVAKPVELVELIAVIANMTGRIN